MDFPKHEYSKNEVIRSGKALKGELFWTPETREETTHIFNVANSWISSHAFPLSRIRAQLHGRMSAEGIKGLTAARLKRMNSVREKLRRLQGNLRQLQDLGGCRAVVTTIKDVKSLASAIKKNYKHELIREYLYLDSPRESGYRSHHLVYAFKPKNEQEETYSGRRIEIQIRSRLQHSWATSVEAVGLFENQDLKGGQGNEGWLRLFYLMSRQLAFVEGSTLDKSCIVEEKEKIRSLCNELKAIQQLETLSLAAPLIDQTIKPSNINPKYCRIIYDHTTKSVSLKYHNSPNDITEAYSKTIKSDDKDSITSVLVEFDKIETLKQAYPNYFGDVQLFKKNLGLIIDGSEPQEYKLPPLQRVPPPPKEIPDDSWLRGRNKMKWDE